MIKVSRYKITEPVLVIAGEPNKEKAVRLEVGDTISVNYSGALLDKQELFINTKYIDILPLFPMPTLKVFISTPTNSSNMSIVIEDYQGFTKDDILAKIKEKMKPWPYASS